MITKFRKFDSGTLDTIKIIDDHFPQIEIKKIGDNYYWIDVNDYGYSIMLLMRKEKPSSVLFYKKKPIEHGFKHDYAYDDATNKIWFRFEEVDIDVVLEVIDEELREIDMKHKKEDFNL